MNGMKDMPTLSLPATGVSSGEGTSIRPHPMMHITFFWAKNREILFPGWPGSSTGRNHDSQEVIRSLSNET
ncbi:hypothetical protein HanXRQr2_Chr11g0492481 [Helianthus annuus]|uniref:Uncharacterized protein n=1 Tax=Helianthus annuus TaxID=4232 RepID=A0A251TC27_HELAN|nr:hypothetical protein HanXRQr2_Chr11g0492481 [Helianthus annuus]KAJ0509562.1 hypothetical protein HanIR_Chr11g0530271 [Helianthus annuus]KAJ0875300.1 hypothetical protein HanPSC8_Chr11g0474601 [Helianthus annuus]